MTTMPTPADSGRGAWTKRGNLMSKSMYLKGCSASVTAATTQDKWAVNRGVWAIQKLLGIDYTSGPGLFGPRTDRAVRDFQAKSVPPADGIAGPNTLRALLRPVVAGVEQNNGIPARLLWGLVGAESNWDPGAIGYGTPYDAGLVQINLKVNVQVLPDQAMDPYFSLPWAAQLMARRAQSFRDQGVKDVYVWNAVVLSHNSPSNGRKYAFSGVYPTTQAEAYVAKVKEMARIP